MLFSALVFLNAFLLFWIEPLFSKTLLPIFGGSPSVWTTAVFFYQLLVLLGYLYAHLADRFLSFRWQLPLQLILLAASLLWAPRPAASNLGAGDLHLGSIGRQLWIMATHLGLPFFTVCTFSTLAQRWYSRLRRENASDPYFLYTASNLGSMAALVFFPLLMEPWLGTGLQMSAWRGGLLVLLLLAAAGGLRVNRGGAGHPSVREKMPSPGWRRMGSWVLWSFIPSGVMLAVTTLISVDLVSFPLLWIIPLLLYLLSFVLAFSPRIACPLSKLRRILVFSTVFVLFAWLTDIDRPLWLVLGLYLLFLFSVSWVYHKRLQADRPQAGKLTLFYLCLSLGGVLAGAFNSLAAPLLFDTILEFPLLLALALLALVDSPGEYFSFLGAGVHRWGVLLIAFLAFGLSLWSNFTTLEPFALWMVLIFGLPLLLSLFLEKKPAALALALAMVMLSSSLFAPIWGKVELRRRNFFGTLSVLRDRQKGITKLFHGTTQHGIERKGPGFDGVPLAYYHPSGPCGLIFSALYRDDGPKTAALIGLGIGSQLAYARRGDRWTIFEIDPDVIDVATDGRWFSYWKRCPADKRLIRGDGRVQLRAEPPGSYDLIVVDAFNSDAIPLHLLTREAFDLYLHKLKRDGLLAMHITNRNVDLLGQLQQQASALELSAVSMVDGDDSVEGKFMSHWLLFSRVDLSGLTRLRIGKVRSWLLEKVADPRPWRDDWNNLVSVIRWRQ